MKDLTGLTRQELDDVLTKPFVTFPVYYCISLNLMLISIGMYLQTSQILCLFAYLPAIVFQSSWTFVQRNAESRVFLRRIHRFLLMMKPLVFAKIVLALYLAAWLVTLAICSGVSFKAVPVFDAFENFVNLQACAFLMPFLIPLFVFHHRLTGLVTWSVGYLLVLILVGDVITGGLFRQNILLALIGFVSGALIAACLMVVCGLYYQNTKQKKALEETLLLLHVIMMNTSSAMALINGNMKVVGEPSLAFDKLFGKQSDLFQVLKNQSHLPKDEIHKLKEAISMVVGEQSIAFELNRNSFPGRLSVGEGKDAKVLDVSWDVAADPQDIIAYVIVTFIDVTESLANERREYQMIEEMRKLIRLSNAGQERFLIFHDSLDSSFKDIISELDSLGTDHWPKGRWLGTIHTLKGGARSLEMKEAASLLHELEQLILQNDEPGQSRHLLEKLDAVMELVSSDLEMARKHFHWDTSKEFYRISKKRLLSVANAPSGNRLMEIFEEIFPDVGLYLQERLAEANVLAVRLGKERPLIEIQAESLLLLPGAAAVLDSALPHILGNAMDHGIETGKERLALGKPSAGKITARVEAGPDAVHVFLSDDGRGLDFESLRQKVSETSGEAAAEAMGAGALIEMVFRSGITTKDRVSEISGRGVGMGAAREAIRAAGGDMSLIIPQGVARGERSAEFTVQITLPASLFLKRVAYVA